MDELVRFLDRHRDRDVLLSAETLTEWLFTRERQDSLLELIGAAQAVVPTRCVWTLRRLDSLVRSLRDRPRAVGDGKSPLPLTEDVAASVGVDRLFAGMRRVESLLEGDVVYVKYESSGGHNRTLLQALGIPEPLCEEILHAIERAPSLNPSLSTKQTVVLVNLSAISAKLGIALDEGALREAFFRGELRFDRDRPFELDDRTARERLYRRSIDAAKDCGFSPYVEFFAESSVRPSCYEPLGLEALTEADLKRLAAFARAPAPQNAPGASP